MHTILDKQLLAPKVYRLRIRAPEVARVRRAGQFVALRVTKEGERFPLTIVDSDPGEGSITLIIQEVGLSTQLLCSKNVGEAISDIAGPLGHPTEVGKFGNVVCVGGGIGVAPLYPIAKALKQAGNKVTTIIGARTKDLIILEQDMRGVSDDVVLASDDGSIGMKGFVSDVVKHLVQKEGRRFDFCAAIGPVPMMRAVCGVTKELGIRTMVSLNPIMVDGTGMCGGCRVLIGGQTKFACVDGPEFDGHQVDFAALTSRLRMYDYLKEQCVSGAFAPAQKTS
ncbi:MAG: sulfide/dihydroorotate dehydrogenase-like FAD/NAD-binding protein [Planctomycetota bacterium]|nr:sulfide/dihydroorotate dehydrogenase-like FAD/NAD-binding protein [Planctomycetota bacterium]